MLLKILHVIHTLLPWLPHYFAPFGKTVRGIASSQPIVALSFDDGPHPAYTPAILDILAQKQVKATFFMVGQNVEQYPEIVQAVIKSGNEVGNHSYSHSFLIFKSCSYIRKEIDLTDSLLGAAGVEDEILFRAPYGTQLIALPIILRQLRRKHILYGISPRDWIPQDPQRIVEYVMKRIRPGSILTLHDGDPAGRQIIDYTSRIIDQLQFWGFKIVTVSELLVVES